MQNNHKIIRNRDSQDILFSSTCIWSNLVKHVLRNLGLFCPNFQAHHNQKFQVVASSTFSISSVNKIIFYYQQKLCVFEEILITWTYKLITPLKGNVSSPESSALIDLPIIFILLISCLFILEQKNLFATSAISKNFHCFRPELNL